MHTKVLKAFIESMGSPVSVFNMSKLRNEENEGDLYMYVVFFAICYSGACKFRALDCLFLFFGFT